MLSTRYIYNNFLAERKSRYEESKTKISVYEQLKELTGLERKSMVKRNRFMCPASMRI